MANWAEIERMRKDPRAVRALAKAIRKREDLRTRDRKFLDDLIEIKIPRAIEDPAWPLQTATIEVLLYLRDSPNEECTVTDKGFSVAELIKQCVLRQGEADYVTNEDHIEFLEKKRG